MKYLLAAIAAFSGMVVTLSVLAFALKLLNAEPLAVEESTAASAPVLKPQLMEVDRREPDRPSIENMPALKTMHIEWANNETGPEIDFLTTESLAEPEVEEPPTPSVAHAAWCSSQYRSYRPDDNSYTSYSGEIRECVSPYSGGGAKLQEGIFMQASAAYPSLDLDAGATAEHIDSCLARYRSYRPEDNTYQPYGGGPRRQCQ